jgi:two-component system chemotaxis response regulator CheB
LTIEILLADDSKFIRKKIIEILNKEENFKLIDFATDGEEAVEMADFYQPDVLLLDLMMPKMNGLEAFEKIMDNFPIPTIILSALNPKDMDISVQALLFGAFDYVIKPESMDSKKFLAFQNLLVSKIKAAYNSKIGTERSDKGKTAFETAYSLRQQMVDKAFQFGSYINKLKPSAQNSEIQQQSENQIKFSQQKKKATKFPSKKPQIESPKKPRKQKSKTGKTDKQKQEAKESQDQHEQRIEKQKSVKESIPIKNRSTRKDLVHEIEEKIKKQKETIKSKYDSKLKSLEKKISSPKKGRLKFKSRNFSNLKPIKKVDIQSPVILIGASVGGPRTLKAILSKIPSDIQSPILIVQHIERNFSGSLAKNLNQYCKIKVKIGENGDSIKNGIAYISPGAFHMEVAVRNRSPIIRTYSGKPVNFCIPSIDVLFISAARVFKDASLGILLTGMGVDGVNGLKAIRRFGGKTIAESEETSVLFGMPKVAIKHGLADNVLPNYKIPEYITHFSKSR